MSAVAVLVVALASVVGAVQCPTTGSGASGTGCVCVTTKTAADDSACAVSRYADSWTHFYSIGTVSLYGPGTGVQRIDEPVATKVMGTGFSAVALCGTPKGNMFDSYCDSSGGGYGYCCILSQTPTATSMVTTTALLTTTTTPTATAVIATTAAVMSGAPASTEVVTKGATMGTATASLITETNATTAASSTMTMIVGAVVGSVLLLLLLLLLVALAALSHKRRRGTAVATSNYGAVPIRPPSHYSDFKLDGRSSDYGRLTPTEAGVASLDR